MLTEIDLKGSEHPVAYACRKLQPREEKLSTTEKEGLAIVWPVKLFRYYLFRRKLRLQTDHNPLVWLNKVRDKNRKLIRWSITSQEYDMVVEHGSVLASSLTSSPLLFHYQLLPFTISTLVLPTPKIGCHDMF